ncbi:hypothetical protein [Paraflavitalea pollutisoli]|uniref:hypothetical protein n=1 Tax=Paraflavitalea pollutisoli TaxID=3034143 RepID=UPI0023EC951F|nr:hypothetical protein [Paraflavitalea sp. H1-2-19X]
MKKETDKQQQPDWKPNNTRAEYHFKDLVHEQGKDEGKKQRLQEEEKHFETAKEILQNDKQARERTHGIGTDKNFVQKDLYPDPDALAKIKNKHPVNDISSHAIENTRTGEVFEHKLVNEQERASSLVFFRNKQSFKEKNKAWMKQKKLSDQSPASPKKTGNNRGKDKDINL